MGQSISGITDNYIYFFPDQNYKGTPFVVSNPITLSNVSGTESAIDKISSLIVPSGFEVFLFRHPDFEGDYRQFRGPVSLPNLDVNQFDEGISSLIVAKLANDMDIPSDKQLTLTYPGRIGNETLLLEAPFEINNVTKLGIPNNSLAQVKLGSAVSLSAYDNENFLGDHEAFNGPYSGGLNTLIGKASSLRARIKPMKNLQVQNKQINPLWIILLLVIILLIVYFLIIKK